MATATAVFIIISTSKIHAEKALLFSRGVLDIILNQKKKWGIKMFEQAEKLYDEEKYEEALKLYYELEKTDHAEAIYSIGWCLEHGLGVAEDYVAAVEKYKKAFSLSYVKAAKRIGECYEEGGYGLEQNYHEALDWYIKAADAGVEELCYKIGSIYKELDENDKAKEAFEKGIENNEADCYAGLGQWYLTVENRIGYAWENAKKAHEAGSLIGSQLLYSILFTMQRYLDAFEPAKAIVEKLGANFEEQFVQIAYHACANECDIADAVELSKKYHEGVNGKIYYEPAAACAHYAMEKINNQPYSEVSCDVAIQAAKLFLDEGFPSHSFEHAVSVLTSVYDKPNVKEEAVFMLAQCYDNPKERFYNPKGAETWMKNLAADGYEPAKKYCEKYKIKDQYIAKGLCSYCGGELKGLFTKKCVRCGKPKAY